MCAPFMKGVGPRVKVAKARREPKAPGGVLDISREIGKIVSNPPGGVNKAEPQTRKGVMGGRGRSDLESPPRKPVMHVVMMG